jgi:hypothetical protein
MDAPIRRGFLLEMNGWTTTTRNRLAAIFAAEGILHCHPS